MCITNSTDSEQDCYCEEKIGKRFLRILRDEGVRRRCDESSESFRKGMRLPGYYDEDKFKRGQDFFHQNIFAMLYAKMLGLISDLSLISSLNILEFTNQSSEPLTAYRRYVSTIISMYQWYSHDLNHDSKSWKSLTRIRNLHNSSSLRAHEKNVGEITQYHMALAQFGFVGLIISKPKEIGIHNSKLEDMEALVHFWRVIGFMLGLEDEFNLCQNSYDETKEVCDEILREVINPAVTQWDKRALKMTTALIEGLWAMMPMLQTKVWINLLYNLINDDFNNNNEVFGLEEELKMNFGEKMLHKIIKIFIYLLRFNIVKIVMKYNIYLILFLTKNFPFLAYYKYGWDYKHSKFVESADLSCPIFR